VGHAALFVGWFNDPKQGVRIIVVEQYRNSGGKIVKRSLQNRGKNADGSYVQPSNNGEAYSVIL